MALSDGLIHRYTCNEATGDLIDVVGGLNMLGTTALLPISGFNAPVQEAGRVPDSLYSMYGRHKNLNGATGDAFAYVADDATVRFAAGTPKTLGFWFYPIDDGAGNSSTHALVSDLSIAWFGSPSFQGAWYASWHYDPSAQFIVNFDIVYGTGQTSSIHNASNQYPNSNNPDWWNHWHTVVIAYDGTTFTLYLDCETGSSTSQAPAPYGTGLHFCIGGAWITNPTSSSNGWGANAYLDEVCFWDHVLTGDDMGLFCDGEQPVGTIGLEVYLAGARNGDPLSGIAYGTPTVFGITDPAIGTEYILEMPAADLANFLQGNMGNVKLRRAGSGGSYTGDVGVRAIEIVYKQRQS